MTVNHGVPGSSPGEGAKRENASFLFFSFMHFLYIIFSVKTGKYYIGETPDVPARLAFHNNVVLNTNSTKTGIPWELFWYLKLENRGIAKKIESHIKRMKNVKYYENLKKYPELSEKLILKYKD